MISISTVTTKGQATIPTDIRQHLNLRPGDKIGFESLRGKVILRKINPFDSEYHQALSGTLSEWASPEDDEANRDI